MSKKYLSIEEAAGMLGMDTSELNRLREKGEIRAFADRGTWKFKLEEIEKLSRNRQADSDPEIPLQKPRKANLNDDQVVLGDDDDALSEQPTIIRKSAEEPDDSDVKLLFDESIDLPGHEVKRPMRPLDDSISDVRLTPEIPLDDDDDDIQLQGSTSESDVKLIGDSDSDVKLVDKGTDSDSDVKLVGDTHSDSDVRLAGTTRPASDSDSDVKLVSSGILKRKGDSSRIQKDRAAGRSDSDVALVAGGKSGVTGGKSGLKGGKPGSGIKGKPPAKSDETDEISLAPLSDEPLSTDDVTINLSPVDSGSVLDDDSGISLSGDSGLALASESGISLERVNDSGISLDDDSGLTLADSGISLDTSGDSGISLDMGSKSAKGKGKGPKSGKPAQGKPAQGKPAPGKKKQVESDDDLSTTIPMMDSPLGGDDDLVETQFEVPLLSDDDDAGDIPFASDSNDTTSVIMLDDESDVDESSATMVKKGRKAPADDDLLEEEAFDDSVSDGSDSSDDTGDDTGDDSDLEVSDEILGEDDELEDLDVFGAEEDDFEPEMETGESQGEMPVAAAGRMAAPVEHEWGAVPFVGLALSTILMVMCGTVAFDLVRNMWYTDIARQNPLASAILDALRGML